MKGKDAEEVRNPYRSTFGHTVKNCMTVIRNDGVLQWIENLRWNHLTALYVWTVFLLVMAKFIACNGKFDRAKRIYNEYDKSESGCESGIL